MAQNCLFLNLQQRMPMSSTSSEDDDADFEVDTQCSSKDPHFPNQNGLDDLTRDLGLTKAKAEILSSRLKE